MKWDVRSAKLDDIDGIGSVILHDEVRPCQRQRVDKDTLDTIKRQINGTIKDPTYEYENYVIDINGTIGGHILSSVYRIEEGVGSYCGWDLHPDYWGQGVMAGALKVLFGSWFDAGKLDFIISDCYGDNYRCMRMMGKVGYEPQHISFKERVVTAWRTKRLKWVCRFCLTKDKWLKEKLA